MAIEFPVPAAQFADTLKISSVTWRLREFTETSGTALGQVITQVMAPAKWQASVALAAGYHADVNRIVALCEAIGATGTFRLYNPMAEFPAADPTGALLGSATPSIEIVGADFKSLRVRSLPPFYELRAGDMLQVTSGARSMLLRVAEDATASAAGLTPIFEVRPHLRSWVAQGQAVTLARPSAKMMFAPGSFDPGSGAPLIASGVTFDAIEVY
jgi:hypothetical protein